MSKKKPSDVAEIYKDKHTLVEVTIHRRPKVKVSKSWSESLSDSENVVFKRPTSISHKSKSPVKRGKSRSREADKENQMSTKTSRICEQPDHSELISVIDKLKLDLERSKNETFRYKSEYGVLAKQVEISKTSVSNLEEQVVNLKQIISKLTSNNSELLEIVAEKINYEEKISELEKSKHFLAEQLQMEQSESIILKQKLREAQAEIQKLKSVTSGILSDLPDLEPARVPSMNLGDETRNVLGLKDDDEDSAYEDPRTDSIRSVSKNIVSGKIISESLPAQQAVLLNVELSESEDVLDGRLNIKERLNKEVEDLSLKMGEIHIPKPKPFPEGSLHLSLSSLSSDHQGATLDNTTLSEGKFLRGLEDSIELNKTNMTSHSE